MSEAIEVISPLTQDQLDRLAAIETGIQNAINAATASFKEIGALLEEVQSQKLYLKEHHSFEEYTQARWNFSRIRAHQLIEGASVAQKLLTMVNIPNERVAREFAKIPEPQQVKVAKAVAMKAKKSQKPVTAKVVQDVAATIIPRNALHAQMLKVGESTRLKGIAIIDLNPKFITPCDLENVLATKDPKDVIESVYQANKVRWNNPPPPSPRIIVDAILKGFQ